MTRRATAYQPGDRIGGRYLVHKALAGGMGEVYLCLDEEENLKPDNVLINQTRIAKITDFGLAKVAQTIGIDANSDDVRQSNIGGTSLYMAPEQWRGEALDQRTDMYAVGCILYELLTGDFVYIGSTVGELRRQHLSAVTPPIPSYADVQPIIEQCLAKDPAERYSTVDSLLAALRTVYQHRFDENPQVEHASDTFAANDYTNRGSTYRALGRYQQALHDHQQALALAPDIVQIHYNLGVTFHAMQQYQQALDSFSQAQALDPTLAQIYGNRGTVYHDLGHHQEALSDYHRALELDSSFAPIYYNRGNTYHALGRYQEALADYHRALELDASLAPVYVNRANIYYAAGQYEAALADYDRAIALDSTLVTAFYSRGNIYANQGQVEKAMQDYNRALTLAPDNVEALYNRGGLYRDLGQHQQALADYDRALEIDPAFSLALGNRGAVHALLGNYDAALMDCNRTLELTPNDSTAYLNRGGIYYMLQQHEQALADWKQVIALDPSLAKPYVNIGVLLYQQGQPHEALQYLDKAVQRGSPEAAPIAQQIKAELGMGDPNELAKAAFEAFWRAGSLVEMRAAVTQYPFMTQPNFISMVQQVIAEQVPAEHHPAFQQRLAVLKQIAAGK